jgi:4-hydroxy-3-methylbut-2-enyl diphosphate reductase
LDFGPIQIFLARHFGFCYGVENAIEIAFETIEENIGKRIFLLSEMIHNPQVNADLAERGVQFLQDTYGKQIVPFDELKEDDVVVVPAFGTTLEIEELLRSKNIQIEKYNTTCPFVEKVWNRSAQIAEKGYSIVVHGKPKHEETRATFSHASSHTPTVVVNDMKETIELAKYITEEKPAEEFYTEFKGRYSKDFDVTKDLQRIGVVNQTTQLATDTQAIAEYLKNVMMQYYGLNEKNISERFADTRDTLCYATNDNQSAVTGMLQTEADLAIVVGGYNSSNTSHLVELCEEKLLHILSTLQTKIISDKNILHCNWRTKEEKNNF